MCRISLLAVTLAAAGVIAVAAQPPEKRQRGGEGGARGEGGLPRFELGRVLPPPVREELNLSPEQAKQIADLEREVKERLSKILTSEQQKQVENFRPRGGPGGGGPAGGGPAGGESRSGRGRRDGGGPPGKTPPEKNAAEKPQADETKVGAAGIQWFATWESGLAEAQRTGRPILLVSAAPHCAGVSGIW